MEYVKAKYDGKDNLPIEAILSYRGLLIDTSLEEFLSYSDGVVTNKDLIRFMYDFEEQANSTKENPLYIKPNTDLLYPKDKLEVNKAVIYGSNQVLTQADFDTFQPDFVKLIESEGYVKSEIIEMGTAGNSVQYLNQNCKIWVWSRALSKVIDISRFIQSVDTNVSGDIGSFSISLQPIKSENDITFIGRDTLNYFVVTEGDRIALSYFDKYLQENDVVFIRFERLEMETDKILESIEVPFSEINDSKVWDFIGLIDTVPFSYSSYSTSVNVAIQGRNLMKVLLEDGAYFLPYQYVEGKDDKNKFVYGGEEKSSWFKRNFVSGAYDYFFNYDVKQIQDALGFIINHLSNIGICDDQLFSGYSDKSKVLQVTGADKNYLETKDVRGIWQIIKLRMDSVLSDRVFVGDSLSNPDGTLIDFFNQVCQKPFVEFWGDTWGSYFNFTVRQPPFTKSAIKNVIDNQYYLTINQRDIINISLSFDERCYSSYEIEPNNTFFGSEDGLFKAIVPALYINEYAEIWGNKRYSVKDSYVHKNSLFGGDASLDSSKFIEGLLNDYKYIIETNAYLPFTRKGSITINGDRRIKKGTFVFNEATNEIFYVSGVSNTLSINRQKISRTTTLQVERGMIKDFINRKSVADTDGIVRFFSYFDIVNVDTFVNQIRKSINVSNEKKTTTESKVKLSLVLNKDNFQFFLRRGQL